MNNTNKNINESENKDINTDLNNNENTDNEKSGKNSVNVEKADYQEKINELERDIKQLEEISRANGIDLSENIAGLKKRLADIRVEKYKNLTPYERVCISRDIKRPSTLEYISKIFNSFIELHGDRLYGDDPAIVGGIASLGKYNVTVIGHQKGSDINENIKRNFGMANPEGYRKALRLMKQAEKFNRPIITFIDTSGAYCGTGAEERGQGEAIARNLMEMSALTVPVICFVIGEGGSGGALGIGVGNDVCMLENSVYSVISPEGLSSILFKDSSKSKEACEVMKMTAKDLYNLNIIEHIIKEPVGGAQNDADSVASEMKDYIIERLDYYSKFSGKEIAEKRYEKFRSIGRYF